MKWMEWLCHDAKVRLAIKCSLKCNSKIVELSAGEIEINFNLAIALHSIRRFRIHLHVDAVRPEREAQDVPIP